MPEEIKSKYKKDSYYHTNNDNYINKKEYAPITAYTRELNPVTEQYEYKEHIINHELEWENTSKAILLNDISEIKGDTNE